MNTSSSQYVGLFGYSRRLTIRNVILDSSCSIMSSFIGSWSSAYVGGFIGYGYANNGPCTIENSVNMASVSFTGNTGGSLYLGGIAGVMWSSNNNEASMKNCVNYGTVTNEGTVGGYFDIGGIVGHFRDHTKSIQNCINYGTIRNLGSTANYMYMGGILGFVTVNGDISQTEQSSFENCLSAGKIEPTTPGTYKIGGIVGHSYGYSSKNMPIQNSLNYGTITYNATTNS